MLRQDMALGLDPARANSATSVFAKILEYIATDMAYLKYLWLGEVQHYDATKLGQGDSTKNLKRSKHKFRYKKYDIQGNSRSVG